MDDFAYVPIACSIFTDQMLCHACEGRTSADPQKAHWQSKVFEHFLPSRFPGGFTNVRSEGCPGLRSNPDGFRTGTPM
jgi:hypothetical protein